MNSADNDPNLHSTCTRTSPSLLESSIRGLYSDTESAALEEYFDQQRDEQTEGTTDFEDIVNMSTAAMYMMVEYENPLPQSATAAGVGGASLRDLLKTPERLGSSGGTSPKELEPSVTNAEHAVTGTDQQVMTVGPQHEMDYDYNPFSDSAVPEMIETHYHDLDLEQCDAVPNPYEKCSAPTPGPKTPNRKRPVNRIKKSEKDINKKNDQHEYTTTARQYNFKRDDMTPQECERRFKNTQACRRHRDKEKLRKSKTETQLQQLMDECIQLKAENTRLEAENTRLKSENKKKDDLNADA